MFGRILVTGYSGFVGSWVIAELRRQFPKATVIGAGRRSVTGAEARSAPHRHLFLDLRQPETIEAAVAAARPDVVVHLASLKSAPLDELFAVNVAGCERLLAALARVAPAARAIVIGSAAELGRSGTLDLPIDENARCEPVDHYGITKFAQSAVACRQALLGQDVVRLRPFNMVGPAMPDCVLPGRCVGLLRVAARAARPVELEFGPLETRRDYVDVRDFARAVPLALRKSPPGMLYHVGSGVNRSGYEVVDALIAQSDLPNVVYKTVASTNAALIPWQTADIRRAGETLGWWPAIAWQQSIRDAWEPTCSPERRTEMAASG